MPKRVRTQISVFQPISGHVDERAVCIGDCGIFRRVVYQQSIHSENCVRDDLGSTTAGLVGLMVRWHESYLIDADFGHIPVSNLY